MDLADVVAILEALADGAHPLTGEQLPAHSPYNVPQVIRALFTAARELRLRPGPPAAPGARPPKAGQPWSPEEDQRLRQEFAAKVPIPEVARRHQRTRVAIMARLMRLGLLRPYGSGPAAAAAGLGPGGPQDAAGPRARAGRAWTAEEDAELLKAYDAGLSIEELARRLRRGHNAIDVRLCKLGRGVEDWRGPGPNQPPQQPGHASDGSSDSAPPPA
jgi:hypothetical protein